ncbi:MAG: hypothetical protein ABIK61_07475 [candidate division WOR-3 bacterium]
MKYHISINQAGVFVSGLLPHTDLIDWAIVDYLLGVSIALRMVRKVIDGEEYVWVSTPAIVRQIPIIHLKRRAVHMRLRNLEKLGLIAIKMGERRQFYIRLTDKILSVLYFSTKHAIKDTYRATNDTTCATRCALLIN